MSCEQDRPQLATRCLRGHRGLRHQPGHRCRRRSPLGTYELSLVLFLNIVVGSEMWLRHGGLDRFGSVGGALIGIGQIPSLYATVALPAMMLLTARVLWIERAIGVDASEIPSCSRYATDWCGRWRNASRGSIPPGGVAWPDRTVVCANSWLKCE